MAKNGFPPVFSRTSCASDAARSGSQRSTSAISCPRRSWASGASVISAPLPPAPRLAASRLDDQLPGVLLGERAQRDLCVLAAGGLDGLELPSQRKGSIDF